MTENEARKKWCPHTKSLVFEDTIYNNRGEYWNGALPNCCIASDCMMWVENKKYKKHFQAAGTPPPDSIKWKILEASMDYGGAGLRDVYVENTLRGNCGLIKL